MSNEKDRETFEEMIARGITPNDSDEDGWKYNMLLPNFIWEMASLVTNLRADFVEQNSTFEVKDGERVIEEGREAHEADAFDLKYFDALYGWNAMRLRVDFNRFIWWLLDQEIDEELPDIDIRYYVDKWNEFITSDNAKED